MTKSKLFKELNFLPINELRKKVNEVIAFNRNLSLDKAKYKKIIRPNELEQIKTFFGVEI